MGCAKRHAPPQPDLPGSAAHLSQSCRLPQQADLVDSHLTRRCAQGNDLHCRIEVRTSMAAAAQRRCRSLRLACALRRAHKAGKVEGDAGPHGRAEAGRQQVAADGAALDALGPRRQDGLGKGGRIVMQRARREAALADAGVHHAALVRPAGVDGPALHACMPCSRLTGHALATNVFGFRFQTSAKLFCKPIFSNSKIVGHLAATCSRTAVVTQPNPCALPRRPPLAKPFESACLNSTRPCFTSLMAAVTLEVTVPSLGLGIRPRGPRMRAICGVGRHALLAKGQRHGRGVQAGAYQNKARCRAEQPLTCRQASPS